MNIFRTLTTLFSLTLSTVVLSAHLPDDIEPGNSVNEIQLPLTKESAAELIRVESGGKTLSVTSKKYNDEIIFHIKVLHDNGTIRVYRLNPKTGHAPH